MLELFVGIIAGFILGVWLIAGQEKNQAETGKAFTVNGRIYRMVEIKTEEEPRK